MRAFSSRVKKFTATLAATFAMTASLRAAVYLNEMIANAPGADGGLEYFELRGTPNMALAGHYLLSVEGQGAGRGDTNQFFDLGASSLGANGYLIALQNGSPYSPTVASATVLQNSGSVGWGQANTAVGSSVAHSSDGAQTDLENSATTILLVSIGGGAAPTLTLDLDTDNDGFLNLPADWSVLDSIGLLDGVGADVADTSYGAITFRVGGVGDSANGNVVDVPGTGTSLYVGRRGDSIGSTTNDWFGAIPTGSGGNFTFGTTTDPFYAGRSIAEMQFGGPNPVPEPGSVTLLSLGFAATLLTYRRRM